MTRFITLLLPFLVVACSIENNQSNRSYEAPKLYDEYASEVNETSQNFKEPYEIKFQIDKVKDNEYDLLVAMELVEGSKFVSPHARNNFTGKFNISLEKNVHLEMESTFIETPRSVEELDMHPFSSGLVNWVRVNTTYQHQLRVLSQDDFEVSGMVSFAIEPRCTFEEIAFTIVRRSGEMEIKI